MSKLHCQKCRTPLKLDSSLESLNPASFNVLVGSTQAQPKHISSSRPAYTDSRRALYENVSHDAGPAQFKRMLPTRTFDSSNAINPQMSYVMLSGSEIAPPVLSRPQNSPSKLSKASIPEAQVDGTSGKEGIVLSADMERANRLFEIMSSRSDIDHPICVECTAMLVEGLEKRLEVASKERDAYVTFLKSLQNDEPTEAELQASREALAKAKKDEEDATADLLKLEAEKRAVEAEMAALQSDLALSAKEVDDFCIADNIFSLRLHSALNKQSSIVTSLGHDSQQLNLLQRTNVHNDTFSISHDGIFGTINSLRLGRQASHPVDWPEINAAWGHTLLLLSTVARSVGYKFKGYELAPMGSTSSIIEVGEKGKKRKLELWTQAGAGDMILGLTFMHRKFDAAMVAFLECLKQIGDFVELQSRNTMEQQRLGGVGSREGSPAVAGATGRRRERGLQLPYLIEGDKIGGYSIRLGVAQDDGWSSACKYVLTCCKYLLAHRTLTWMPSVESAVPISKRAKNEGRPLAIMTAHVSRGLPMNDPTFLLDGINVYAVEKKLKA